MKPFKVIRLTQGKATIVDPEDYEQVSKYKWHARYDQKTRSFRALHSHRREVGRSQTTFYLARLITCAPSGTHADHINHDTLDNRKCNLRVCTPSENGRSRRSHIKEYKGVHWHSRDHIWAANIRVNKKLIHLGSFKDKLDAARAYNEAATYYFGEFACLNPLE